MEKKISQSQQRYCHTSQTSVLPWESLWTIYISFIRPYFNYGDVIYDQSYNDSFHAGLESYQYKAALLMTGAINLFHTTGLYWYPVKTSENLWFSVFRGVSKEISGMKWVKGSSVEKLYQKLVGIYLFVQSVCLENKVFLQKM